MKPLIGSLLLLAMTHSSFACDCYGPQSFCGVQAPPPPMWEYTPPDHNILGVKLGEVSYGMDVLVLQSFSGTIAVGDTVRVWGDCGALCRRFIDTWGNGDTVIWGLHDVDYQGNSFCGGTLEQPGDYMITICGLTWLSYANGIVSGAITAETPQNMTLAEFITAMSGCLDAPSGIAEPAISVSLHWDATTQQLNWLGTQAPEHLEVIDLKGRVIMSRRWAGEAIALRGPAAQALIVRVRNAEGNLYERVVVR